MNTTVIALAALGGLFWSVATFRELNKKHRSDFSVVRWIREKAFAPPDSKTASTESGTENASAAITIDALETELGIEPDHYLCDRIARINEALHARRDKQSLKKKGGAS